LEKGGNYRPESAPNLRHACGFPAGRPVITVATCADDGRGDEEKARTQRASPGGRCGAEMLTALACRG